ncbi:SIP domain-containing protein [Curtobacterium sp. MCBA15_001]|uniref:SIP domain-containing protein n=1 Tax=Curtobacterium sp. MCBA15_001 TaxID=1898731 RepID=UPI0008DE9980|nr:SIP domain-containing protein [Curtobacterium sp. MCBA15_001]
MSDARPGERVMLAGAVEDLAEIHRRLVGLSDAAYGQVFVEVALAEQVRILPAPPRVTVTWLVRTERPSAVPPLCFADHGEALAAAVIGWATEWCRPDSEPHTTIWIGCSDSVWIDQARAAVQLELSDAGQQVQVESGE